MSFLRSSLTYSNEKFEEKSSVKYSMKEVLVVEKYTAGKKEKAIELYLTSVPFPIHPVPNSCLAELVTICPLFLDGSTHLYMRVCPSVGWSVTCYLNVENGKF